MAREETQTTIDLTIAALPTKEAVVTLGALAVRLLQQDGVITLFVNRNGIVELAPPGEVELDLFPVPQAIELLLAKNYDDTKLLAYLRGRAARGFKQATGGTTDVPDL